MTVIVAATTAEGVTMAADAQSTQGWRKKYHDQPKLWTRADFAIGAAGCSRTIQVVRHHVAWPKHRPDEDTDWEAWLVTKLVAAIRSGTKDHGVVSNESGIESINAETIVATGSQVAEVGGNGCVLTETCGRAAVGSGSTEALGRLGRAGPWTEADVIDAARRAIQTNMGCSGPISVVNTRDLVIRTVEDA